MKYVTGSVSIAFLAIVAFVAWNVYSQYRKAQGTVWERLLASARNSATMLWGKFSIAVAGIIANLDPIATWIGGPDAANFLNTYIGNPKILAAVMLVISMISMWARTRTL